MSTASSCLVTLHIFSGRTDPTWELSVAQIAPFLALLGALPRVAPRSCLTGRGLGYGGFTIDGAGVAPLTTPIMALNGIVWQGLGAEAIAWADPECTVEQWLLESGTPSLDTSVMRVVVAHLVGERAARLTPSHPRDLNTER